MSQSGVQTKSVPDDVQRQFEQLGKMVADLKEKLASGHNLLDKSVMVGNRLYIFNSENYTVVDTHGKVGYAQIPGETPSSNFNTAYLPVLVSFLLSILRDVDPNYELPSSIA